MSKPTHRFKILDKDNEWRAEVGVGWQNEDGSISIKLNPGIVLDYEKLHNKVLTLFVERNNHEESS